MKVQLVAAEEMSAENITAKTGKTWDEWFAVLDAFDGLRKGRREMNNYLYNELKVDAWWTTTLVNTYEEARGLREKDGRLKGYTICATKTIAVDAETCFTAFATAEALQAWFSDRVDLDFTVGGRFSTDDGNAGEFKKIRPGKDIRITWEQSPGGATVADIVFQAKGAGKCGLMITHDRIQTREEADGLRAAWGAALDRLKTLLENRA